MSTYVIVEEPGDWPCHADYLLTAVRTGGEGASGRAGGGDKDAEAGVGRNVRVKTRGRAGASIGTG